MKAATDLKLRHNHIMRFVLLPFVRIKRQWQYIDYHKRVNTDYLKSIKGTKVGERCFIVGNGPSLNIDDLNMIKGEFTFAFNSIYHIYEKISWRPTYYMIVDKSLISTLRKASVPDLGAKKIFVFDRKLSDYWKTKNNVQEIFLKGKSSIAREKYFNKSISENVDDHFSSSQSVTVNALELAFYMGFSEIYLLGIDHNYHIEVDGRGKRVINSNIKTHFKECRDKESDKYIMNIGALTKCFETCKNYADNHGVKVYNATRGGKLEVFERKKLEDIIKTK